MVHIMNVLIAWVILGFINYAIIKIDDYINKAPKITIGEDAYIMTICIGFSPLVFVLILSYCIIMGIYTCKDHLKLERKGDNNE